MTESHGGGRDREMARIFAGMKRAFEMDVRIQKERTDLRRPYLDPMSDDLLTATNSLGFVGKRDPPTRDDVRRLQTYVMDWRRSSDTLRRKLGCKTHNEVRERLLRGDYPPEYNALVYHHFRILGKITELVHLSYDEESNLPPLLREVAATTELPKESGDDDDTW